MFILICISNFIFKGATSTPNTGPTSAAMGSYYKYGEATAHHPGDEASLESNEPFACK